MTSVLFNIAEHKKQEVAQAQKEKPLSFFEDQPQTLVRDFVKSLQSHNPAIIAEIKKASPSKGIIRADFDVAAIAKTYEQHGAACLSVLTDIEFFKGHPDNLAIARAHSHLPALRKDFIVDPYQIYESRYLGADCVLLIAALLDDHQLTDFCQLAQELHMAVLIESHTADELERALSLPTPLMGINNRSLHSFETNLTTSIELKSIIPNDRIIISESGIHTPQDIKLLQSHGISTFLIGEHLMRAKDIGQALEALL